MEGNALSLPKFFPGAQARAGDFFFASRVEETFLARMEVYVGDEKLSTSE